MQRAADRTNAVIGLRLEGSGRRCSIDARRRAYMVGSGPDADIRVADPHVSSMHCALVRERDGAIAVLDQQSRNGTFIDGVRVDRGHLHDGARLSVGTTTLVAFSARSRARLTVREARRALAWAVTSALERHGSPRAAARALGVGTSILTRLVGGRRR